MHIVKPSLLILSAALLAACGSGQQAAAPAPPDRPQRAASDAAPTGDLSAEQVAEAARGDVACPAAVKTASPPGAPAVDVVGVRPGMTYDEAANVVMCSNPLLVVAPETGRGFDIKSYGQAVRQGFTARFAEPRVQKTPRQIMQEMQASAIARSSNAVRRDIKPGQVKWFVGTMGLPGQERVTNAAREEWFEEGRNPTVDSVAAALVAKYGTPTRQANQGGGSRVLRWAYDPRGRLITETSPLYERCYGASGPDSSVHLSPDCGVVVAATVYGSSDNPALASNLEVGVVDQAGGYAAITATEEGLQAQDAQRRAQQVQEAAKNSQAPQL